MHMVKSPDFRGFAHSSGFSDTRSGQIAEIGQKIPKQAFFDDFVPDIHRHSVILKNRTDQFVCI